MARMNVLRPPAGDVVCASLESPLGPLIAGATAEGICLLEFTDRHRLPAQVDTLRRRFDCAPVPGDSPHFDRLRDELAALGIEVRDTPNGQETTVRH